MTKMREYKHKDILGNDIKVGDACAFPAQNELKIGTVRKCNPKMLDVVQVGKSYWTRRYPHDVYVLNDPKLSLYILQKSK